MSSGPLFHELEDERAGKVLEWTVFNLKLPRHTRDKNVPLPYCASLISRAQDKNVPRTFLFIRDDVEEVVGNENGEGNEGYFDPNDGGKPDGNPHKEVDLPDDFFLALFADALGFCVVSNIELIDFCLF